MGSTAENVASKFHIERTKQDAFALDSQKKAAAAQKAGKFKEQIVPMDHLKGGGLPADEYIKEDATAESLAKLKPAFKKKEGTVTAGNASGINDGAALCLLMSTAKAKELGVPVLATIRAFAQAGVDPKIM